MSDEYSSNIRTTTTLKLSLATLFQSIDKFEESVM
jgi:hypothetical protein